MCSKYGNLVRQQNNAMLLRLAARKKYLEVANDGDLGNYKNEIAALDALCDAHMKLRKITDDLHSYILNPHVA